MFARKLVFKHLYDKSDSAMEEPAWTDEELEAIEILENLKHEGISENPGKKLLKLKPKSKKFPPLNLFPNIDLFVKIGH